LRSQGDGEARQTVAEGGALPISGEALPELMRAVLARGLPFRFRARGWSMAPTIRDGDVITVAPLRRARPGVGRVVAFVRPGEGKLVVHRVVARRRGGSIMRGDSVRGDGVGGDSVREDADGPIPAENVLGEVTRVEREGRAVRLGLGPERYVLAWLSRARLLMPLSGWLASRLGPLLRRRRGT
jgi:hypothetical protein